ncbi:hypothetical protein VTI74DRAFT_1590 [Chaetomium olivicolor]
MLNAEHLRRDVDEHCRRFPRSVTAEASSRPLGTSNAKQAPAKERDHNEDGSRAVGEILALLQPVIVNDSAPPIREEQVARQGRPADHDNQPIVPLLSPASDMRTGTGTPGFENLFTIQPSKLGGLGAFAVRELKRGETILVERPLLRTTQFRLLSDFRTLSEAAKEAYLGLHGGEGGDPFGRVERIKQMNA